MSTNHHEHKHHLKIDDEWKIVRAIVGNFVHCTRHPFAVDESPTSIIHNDREDVVFLAPFLPLHLNHILAVCEEGKIRYFGPFTPFAWLKTVEIVTLPPYAFCCPGFIDLHHHAPQYAYAGTATDRLLTGPGGWLEEYAFPAERSLRDNPEQTRHLFQKVVQATLQRGTTSVVYFGTLDVVPCQQLVDAVLQYGQRAWVGKVCMDRNAPADYCQPTQQNLTETQQLVQYIYETAGKRSTSPRLPLVFPLITPRFIPTCTPELLSALGDYARSEDLHITTHISESIDEVQWSQALEGGAEDATILHQHGLLTRQSILAHGVWLSDTAAQLLRETQSAIAHCPLSNFFFANQSLPCRKLLEQGNLVGLGTDIAGGYNPSMLSACRCAVIASRTLDHQRQSLTNQHEQSSSASSTLLDYRHAFYMATLGGAYALNMQNHLGNFEIGKDFDAVVLTVQSNIFVCPRRDTMADIFQKLCNLADDRNVSHVFVAGKQVIGSS
ncbi:guanine deaminase [Fistulifera solaris]|uniref:Guanine deaminase n=1 Tax=Fistulifera solaris TaxID=1519565 RepID=A0A1Z5KD48_FISSO|nr:guanine deaminase [Fistulifera solaris]|eukprot:GAX24042.1 guanine deaminase [Fistulifera solaris]